MIIFRTMWEFLTNNFFVIFSALLVFADVVVSITPTKNDDIVLGYIRAIFRALFGSEKRRKKQN